MVLSVTWGALGVRVPAWRGCGAPWRPHLLRPQSRNMDEGARLRSLGQSLCWTQDTGRTNRSSERGEGLGSAHWRSSGSTSPPSPSHPPPRSCGNPALQRSGWGETALLLGSLEAPRDCVSALSSLGALPSALAWGTAGLREVALLPPHPPLPMAPQGKAGQPRPGLQAALP